MRPRLSRRWEVRLKREEITREMQTRQHTCTRQERCQWRSEDFVSVQPFIDPNQEYEATGKKHGPGATYVSTKCKMRPQCRHVQGKTLSNSAAKTAPLAKHLYARAAFRPGCLQSIIPRMCATKTMPRSKTPSKYTYANSSRDMVQTQSKTIEFKKCTRLPISDVFLLNSWGVY